MTELVKFGGAGVPANPQDLVKGLQNVGQNLQGSSGGVPFLRLLKSGIYAYGPENIEPEEGSHWAVNPYSIMHGFACWGDGELLDERMVPFNQQPPPRGELPDYGHEWGQQVATVLQCMNGEDEGVSVLYKGTSTGLRNAVKELINSIVAQAQTDVNHIVPVLELDCDSYQHKKYGEIFFPVLNIVKWVSFEGVPNASQVADDSAADDGDDQAPEQAPETAPQPEPPAASRRRRRRASAAKEPEAPPAEPEQPPPATNRRRRRRG